MRCYSLFAILVSLVLLQRPSSAQSVTFIGDVRDSATQALLAKVNVSVLDNGDQIVVSTTTDEHGKFSVRTVHGIFHLRFDKTGMKSAFGPSDTVSTDSVIERTYNASFQPMSFDSVFYKSQVDVPVEMADSRGAPHYPSSLQHSGMRGSVSLSFVVDTTGRAELGSVKTLQSSDGAFFKAVMDALPQMVFTPARVGGRKVRQLVLQRFEFTTPVYR